MAERSILQTMDYNNQGEPLRRVDQSDMDQVKNYISPKEYLVALYVIPLWLCLILICLRGTSRWSSNRRQRTNGNGRNNANTNTENNNNSQRDSRRGLNSRTLQKLRQFRYSVNQSKKKDSKYHTTECSVCMDAFQEGDLIRQLPGCGHFHSECVDEWLKHHPNCPICRKDTREALEELQGMTTGAGGNAPSGTNTFVENENENAAVDVDVDVDGTTGAHETCPAATSSSRSSADVGGSQRGREETDVSGEQGRGERMIRVNPLHVEAERGRQDGDSLGASASRTASRTSSASSVIISWVSGSMDTMARNWNSFRYAARSNSHRSRAREAAVQAALQE